MDRKVFCSGRDASRIGVRSCDFSQRDMLFKRRAEAGDLMPRAEGFQRRVYASMAAGFGERAAGGKTAAGRHLLGQRHGPRNRGQRGPCARRAGDRAHQPDGVRVLRIVEYCLHVARFPPPARRTSPPRCCATSATTPRSWVIISTAVPVSAFRRVQQRKDLRLNGHVQRGGRFVGNQQRGWLISAMAIITRWRMPPES